MGLFSKADKPLPEGVLVLTKCTQGSLIVREDRIEVGLQTKSVTKMETLLFSQITGIDVNTTMARMPGYPGFATVKIFGTGDQTLKATLVKLADAEKVRELVQQRRNTASLASTPQAQTSTADELKKFADLKEQGVITEDEFNAKKKALLG